MFGGDKELAEKRRKIREEEERIKRARKFSVISKSDEPVISERNEGFTDTASEGDYEKSWKSDDEEREEPKFYKKEELKGYAEDDEDEDEYEDDDDDDDEDDEDYGQYSGNITDVSIDWGFTSVFKLLFPVALFFLMLFFIWSVISQGEVQSIGEVGASIGNFLGEWLDVLVLLMVLGFIIGVFIKLGDLFR